MTPQPEHQVGVADAAFTALAYGVIVFGTLFLIGYTTFCATTSILMILLAGAP